MTRPVLEVASQLAAGAGESGAGDAFNLNEPSRDSKLRITTAQSTLTRRLPPAGIRHRLLTR